MAQRKNAAQRRQQAKDVETAKSVTSALMSRIDGRRYVWLKLADAMIFQADVSLDPGQLAWRAGMRNAGLKLLSEVMAYAPNNFVDMMKENGAKPKSPPPEEEPDEFNDDDQ